jgi:hypothetical protein
MKFGFKRRPRRQIIARDDATGKIVIWEAWWQGGKLHRDDGPAVIVRDPATGVETNKQWWKDGKCLES